MFLVFVMLMADSSMTTFADVVGRSVQQNAVEDEENGIDLQSGENTYNVSIQADSDFNWSQFGYKYIT